ncbi:hypothetical protein MGYG_02569 [Nannizzia gypsea CBS 118893]|uniref:Uncharacterized protein n=1 Tax=Arthroderma gypseum (strain ATCC MYA-4604 / CBS 118893) TaxID=535722 RepID=E4UN96_ARTGP|nr:hypothetical protein MGYG_02569 [Nannizzia gypsea CBS 118893]EFQ99557.1 hypothetical protein MGYG_02569 [Nannizzia gypsea CBS 118893]
MGHGCPVSANRPKVRERETVLYGMLREEPENLSNIAGMGMVEERPKREQGKGFWLHFMALQVHQHGRVCGHHAVRTTISFRNEASAVDSRLLVAPAYLTNQAAFRMLLAL